jgi:hypothetical protein
MWRKLGDVERGGEIRVRVGLELLLLSLVCLGFVSKLRQIVRDRHFQVSKAVGIAEGHAPEIKSTDHKKAFMVDQTKASLMFRLNYGEMVHRLFYAKSILESKTPKHRFLLSSFSAKRLNIFSRCCFVVSKTPKHRFLLFVHF